AREGKIIKATGYGVANLELNAPVTPQSVTFALVVGAHDEDHVFERNYDHQRPEDRRDAPQHVVRCELDTVIGMKGLLCGVKRAGANVAVHDAQRRQRQCRSRIRYVRMRVHDRLLAAGISYRGSYR